MDKRSLYQHLNLSLEKPLSSLAQLDSILNRYDLARDSYELADVDLLAAICQVEIAQQRFKRNIHETVEMGSQGLSRQIGRALGREQVLLEIAVGELISAEIAWLANPNHSQKLAPFFLECRDCILNSNSSNEAKRKWLQYLCRHRITPVPPQRIKIRMSSPSP